MGKFGLMIAGAIALSATAAHAGDRHGAAAIQAGDYARAEMILAAEQSGRWTAPETLLNLATVYRHTGRASEARGLYARVLSDSNVLMNVGAPRPLWSHDVARMGMTRLAGTTTLAAR
ncbi:MAG: tetratricopeptide repeat protein [Pseudomonadota bacterium]